MVSKYTESDQSNWDQYIEELIFAYNTSKQSSTGFSPHYLLFGYEARLPVDTNICINEPALNSTREQLQKERELAKEAIQISQIKAKELFDKKRSQTKELKPGAKVMIRNMARQVGKSDKLLEKFKGPFTILGRVADNVYKIQTSNNHEDLVSAERLAEYHERTTTEERPRERRKTKPPVRFKDYV